MINALQNGNLFREGVLALINDGVANAPDQSNDLIGRMINSRQQWEEIITISGLGPMQQMEDGQPVPYDSMNPRYTKRYYPKVYGMAVRHTQLSEVIDVNRFVAQVPQHIANSIVVTRNQQSAEPYNLGFTTMTSPDGKAVFASDHPLRPDATTTTFSNLTTDALTPTSLGVGLQNLASQLGDRGLPTYGGDRAKLVIGPQLEHQAIRVVQSQQMQGTTDNDTNQYISGRTRIVRANAIGTYSSTSNQNWFLVDDGPMKNPFVCIMLMQPKLETWYDYSTKTTNVSVHGCWLYDTVDWRGLYGANVG